MSCYIKIKVVINNLENFETLPNHVTNKKYALNIELYPIKLERHVAMQKQQM